MCGNEFHKFSLVREAQGYLRPLLIDPVANVSNKITEVNHGSCFISDYKQSRQFTALGFRLNSMNFCSLGR